MKATGYKSGFMGLEWTCVLFLDDMSYIKMAYDSVLDRIVCLTDIDMKPDSYAARVLEDVHLRGAIYDTMQECKRTGRNKITAPYRGHQQEGYFVVFENVATLEHVRLVAFFERYERSA